MGKINIDIDTIIAFNLNKSINPKTKRKIKKGGKIYTSLEEQLKKTEPLITLIQKIIRGYCIKSSYRKISTYQDTNLKGKIVNSTDPISMNDLSILFIKFPIDQDRFIAYELETFQMMVKRKMYMCPITRTQYTDQDIESNIKVLKSFINLGLTINYEEKIILDVKKLAQEVFHDFEICNIYLDVKVFLKLNIIKLKNLHFELKDLYYKNTSVQQRNQISDRILFIEENDFTNDLTIFQSYLLENIQCIINPIDSSLKLFGIYLILGGLTLICPEYKEYKNYIFDF